MAARRSGADQLREVLAFVRANHPQTKTPPGTRPAPPMLSKAQLATIAANLLDAATHFRVIAALGPLFLNGAGDALKTKANGAANGEKKLAARRRP
jgi:hypothetical protein